MQIHKGFTAVEAEQKIPMAHESGPCIWRMNARTWLFIGASTAAQKYFLSVLLPKRCATGWYRDPGRLTDLLQF